MSAGEHDLVLKPISLAGCVTVRALLPHLTEIWRVARRRPGTRFGFECAAVLGFSAAALAALAKLRRDLREHGCDLLLKGLSDSVRQSVLNPLFAALVEAELPMTPTPSVPPDQHPQSHPIWKPSPAHQPARREPFFLSLRGTRYQRFWLN